MCPGIRSFREYRFAVHSLIALFLLHPEEIIKKGGLWLVAAIIFAESGLLIGFFLPGDSLLFITGFLATKPKGWPSIDQPLPLIMLVLFIAAVAGDQVGYLFGKRVGPSLFTRPKSRLFNPAHVERASAFLEHYGSKTIVLARFVPVVRTFAPIVAGIGKMKYRTFVMFNLVGGAVWAMGVTALGYFLGKITFVREHVEVAILAVVLISLAPVLFEFIKHRRSRPKAI
jgi:membrane-associated protein